MQFSTNNSPFSFTSKLANLKKDLNQFFFFYFLSVYKIFFLEVASTTNSLFAKTKFIKFESTKDKLSLWRGFEKITVMQSSQHTNQLLNKYFLVYFLISLFKVNPLANRIYYRWNHNTATVGLQNTTKKRFFYFLLGLSQIWSKLSVWLLPLILGFAVLYWSMILRILTVNKVVIGWVILFMMFYWLISGFVFFFKKYQYGKYTSAIQRFWKRSYILFWLLETCLLSVFIYLTFVASQESFYMFDQVQIYKTHLFSWRIFFLKIIPIVILLVSSYFLILILKWNVFSKYSFWLLLLTLTLTYIVWLEFYQFYHIVNFYGNLNWIFDSEERVWNLELETRRTRIVNNYVMWLLILKFWHLLFVYIFWLFFVLRSWEIKRSRYPLLAANFQNILILYLMSWLTMYSWIKVFARKFMDIPYNWFYVNNRIFFWRIFFNDLKIYWYGLSNFLNVRNHAQYSKHPFYYLIETVKLLPTFNTQKHFIKTAILTTLNVN